MDTEDLKYRINNVIDIWFKEQNQDKQPGISVQTENDEESVGVRELPEGKRVVRTKTSGDRVYLLDEVKKTRQWVTNPDVLDSLGFSLTDVGEVDEDKMLTYQMGPALYRRVDAA